MSGPLASFAIDSARPLGQAFLVSICAIIGLQVAARMHDVS